jgi:hypothetical protein
LLGGIEIRIMSKTVKYFIAGFFFITTACDEDSSIQNCLCTISLNGNVWSQYNISNCDTCSAPQGYTANCDCE